MYRKVQKSTEKYRYGNVPKYTEKCRKVKKRTEKYRKVEHRKVQV